MKDPASIGERGKAGVKGHVISVKRPEGPANNTDLIYSPIPTNVTAFTATTITNSNYDARKYPLCAPFDGVKGRAFNDFQDNFLTAIATVDLKDTNETHDLAETLMGTDEGGDVPPPGMAAPIPMGGAAAQRRRLKRLKLSYAHLYQHISDESLRRMLAQFAYNNGREAWRIVVRECFEPVTELELEDLRRSIRDMTILSSVGYSEYSVSKFRRALSDHNAMIPTPADRLPEHELCVLLLSNIAKASVSLAPSADTELKAAPGSRIHVYPPLHPSAGARSLTAIVAHYDPLWRAAIQRGTIPMRAPTSKSGGSTVTGMLVDEYDAADGFDQAPLEPARLGDVLACVAASVSQTSTPLAEIVCWNCKGVGHPKSKCPSDRRERSYSAVIALLSSLSSSGSRAAPARRPAGRLVPRPGSRSMPPRARKKGVSAYLMDDGAFVTSNGEYADWVTAEGDDGSTLELPGPLDADDSVVPATANAVFSDADDIAEYGDDDCVGPCVGPGTLSSGTEPAPCRSYRDALVCPASSA